MSIQGLPGAADSQLLLAQMTERLFEALLQAGAELREGDLQAVERTLASLPRAYRVLPEGDAVATAAAAWALPVRPPTTELTAQLQLFQMAVHQRDVPLAEQVLAEALRGLQRVRNPETAALAAREHTWPEDTFETTQPLAWNDAGDAVRQSLAAALQTPAAAKAEESALARALRRRGWGTLPWREVRKTVMHAAGPLLLLLGGLLLGMLLMWLMK